MELLVRLFEATLTLGYWDGEVMAERRAIEVAELRSVIERLKRCASRAGVVNHEAFASEADRLGLTTEEQQRRLRNGLASLGIHVKSTSQGQLNHSPVTSERSETQSTVTSSTMPNSSSLRRLTRASAVRSSTTTAAGGAEAENPRGGQRSVSLGLQCAATEAAPYLAQARRMLARYTDVGGSVTKLAHDGVVRLHRLSPAEARELTADFPVTRPLMPHAPALAVEGREARHMVPAPASVASVATTAGAIHAARAVLEEDRWRRGSVRVLKADEEVGLAVLLRGGTDQLSRDVPVEEIVALPSGSERRRAHDCLVLHNQRLVWKVAQGFQGHGLEMDDLVQHGNVGLLRAVRRFDATQGYKFSTYASTWIRQRISRGIADEGALIRLPVHVHEKVSKVAKAERKLLSEGRARTVDNVAFVSGLTFAEVDEVRRVSRSTDSLDRIIGVDTALGDLIMGPSRLPGPALVLIRKEFLARMRHVLWHLSERDRHVLIRRAGLDGDEPDTLADIGAVFGITREGIRQVEKKAKTRFREELARHQLVPSRL
ncbi:sigma-70 family RNA polymerase sigma factor [Streptomyces sp. NPDC050738]|uniref:sigma-70 family RNA polymerase sigma factor n=1 Tax=Streptomyces sp. NPDC050738 TaxID=3154744 RepID=UPI0034241FFF